jgi:exodeoxyribonuclease V alpha subunit
MFNRLGIDTVLAAPTGRAAKRMSELCSQEAQTIHRLLGAGFSPDGEYVTFRKNENEPLKCDAIILDECSMVDIMLMRALLCALPDRCRLVLVGDADQLPSVGAGNVFRDIIRSEAVPVVRLTEVFRQAGESRIVRNAHMINSGECPNITENKGDFFFLRRRDSDSIASTVTQLCRERLPKNMGIPATDIQVLCPTRLYESGTKALNTLLQNALNPEEKGKPELHFGERVFRQSDRVMQIRNNYDLICKDALGMTVGTGVFNGDVGVISKIDASNGIMLVDFDGKFVEYGADMLSDLEHAFAMTVHKSQGSEYRAVIIPIGRMPASLKTRGLLYTAVTRARELLIIVGDDETFRTMIQNHKQAGRYSGLRARLSAIKNEL